VHLKTAELTFTHGLQFEAETGSGRQLTYDDDPAAGIGPLESVLSALAACSAMDVISIALKKRQGIERYQVHARAEQREEYPKIFTRVDLVHEVVGSTVDTAAIKRCIELSATKYCPVSAMLASGATEIHHGYRIVRPGQPVEEGVVLVTGPFRSTDPIEPPEA
jgi:putative redox protein